MHLLLRLFLNAFAILAIAYYYPGVTVDTFYNALIVAVVLGILNLLFKPILIVLTLPINLLTLGLFTFVINAFLFWLVGTIVKGFEVHGYAGAFFGALLFSVVSWLGHKLIADPISGHDH